jgi:hypothetical protein
MGANVDMPGVPLQQVLTNVIVTERRKPFVSAKEIPNKTQRCAAAGRVFFRLTVLIAGGAAMGRLALWRSLAR